MGNSCFQPFSSRIAVPVSGRAGLRRKGRKPAFRNAETERKGRIMQGLVCRKQAEKAQGHGRESLSALAMESLLPGSGQFAGKRFFRKIGRKRRHWQKTCRTGLPAGAKPDRRLYGKGVREKKERLGRLNRFGEEKKRKGRFVAAAGISARFHPAGRLLVPAERTRRLRIFREGQRETAIITARECNAPVLSWCMCPVCCRAAGGAGIGAGICLADPGRNAGLVHSSCAGSSGRSLPSRSSSVAWASGSPAMAAFWSQ